MMSVLSMPLLKHELEEAHRVLKLEADALIALSHHLDQSFIQAVDLIYKNCGKVVVTGIGKSGHVARKIAATLSSTGTPSFFVHPAEASHGDLGMITPNDVILALSVSGETTELSDVIEHARRWSLPLIAMTQQPKSTLAGIATTVLALPKIEEACVIGLAPTTSTTMMMALGDALATTLMKRRDFSLNDFSVLHPGGKLGQRLKRVKDLMHKNDKVPLAAQDTLMKDVLLIMTSKSFGCVGLTDDNGSLTGIITDGDLRRHMCADLLDLSANDVMTKNPLTVEGHVLAQEALALLNQFKRTNLFVVDQQDNLNIPIGIIHIHDFLRSNIV